MPQFGQITPAQAFRLIGTPEAPILFDVRIEEDIAALPRVIPRRMIRHTEIPDRRPTRSRHHRLHQGPQAFRRCSCG